MSKINKKRYICWHCPWWRGGGKHHVKKLKLNDFLSKVREGWSQKQIVKNRSTPFCMIYYSIWPNQFPTSCGKCPLLFHEGFLYAYKAYNRECKGQRPKKTIKVLKPKILWFLSKILGEGGRLTWSTICQK